MLAWIFLWLSGQSDGSSTFYSYLIAIGDSAGGRHSIFFLDHLPAQTPEASWDLGNVHQSFTPAKLIAIDFRVTPPECRPPRPRHNGRIFLLCHPARNSLTSPSREPNVVCRLRSVQASRSLVFAASTPAKSSLLRRHVRPVQILTQSTIHTDIS